MILICVDLRSMNLLRALLTCASTAVLLILAAGCGAGSDSDRRPQIVATTAIAFDIARQVAGERADVVQLIPDSDTPHGYQASAQDRQVVAEADLLVQIGNGLDASVPSGDAAAVFAIGEHSGAPLDGHHGEAADPHVWMDPTRVRAALPALVRALTEIDPAGAEEYRAGERAYGATLRELDAKIEVKVLGLPDRNRVLVTSHDALGYFADRYGFEVLETPFGLSPEAEASAQDVRRVIDAVREHDVPALFVEEEDDPQVLERIAEETGATVVDDLLVENYAPIGCCYPEMLRFTAQRIINALKDRG